MNKKFIKVSLIICIPLIFVVGLVINVVKNPFEDPNYEPFDGSTNIEYKDYKEDKYSKIITIIAENNSKDIANFTDINLQFSYLGEGNDPGEISIKGYEKDLFRDNHVMGIEPGEEREIIFKIPKGITFDENLYDVSSPTISYNLTYFKFRTSDRSLAFATYSEGRGVTIDVPELK